MKRIIAGALLLLLVLVSHAGLAFAADGDCAAPPADNVYQVCANSLPQVNANDTKVKAMLTITFGIVGALSLLMVVIGGFRYIVSQGDSQAVAKAKNTIIYALVGVVVAILSVAIVTLVIGKV